MKNFVYYAPTKVVFGKDTENQIGPELGSLGAKKVLLHYGGQSARKSGLLDRVKISLDTEGIEYAELGGVVANPRLSLAEEGAKTCIDQGVDLVLAVGGGSVIDSAKAIAIGAKHNGSIWEFYGTGKLFEDALPVATILTMAAAGSEMSNGSVITNEDGWLKRSAGSPLLRPKLSILNPYLMLTLPENQTFYGVVDMFMHTIERYFSYEKDTLLTDSIAEAVLKSIMYSAHLLVKNPQDIDARADLMWASSVAHNDITGCGRVGDWACHDMEHELSGLYDVPHGGGLSAIFGAWGRHVIDLYPERFAKFAVNVMGVSPDFDDPKECGLEGIEKVEDFFASIKMPISIKDLNVNATDADLVLMADKGTAGDTIIVGGFSKLTRDDILSIFREANK